MRSEHGVLVLEAGDKATLFHPSGGDTVWTIRSVVGDGRCDIENEHGAQLRCALYDLIPAGIGTRHRATDPHTSAAAAASQTPERLSRGRRLALAALANAGRAGATDFEIAERTDTAQTSIGKRRFELAKWGLVVDSGETRPAPSGAAAIVWRITDAGLDAYRSDLEQRAAS